MNLTVVLTSHSDPDLKNTVASIRATAGSEVEILIVDDNSVVPVNIANERIIRTAQRIGVGPARTLGVLSASCEWVMTVDAHMRFTPDWLTQFNAIDKKPDRMYCGVCLGLDADNMDVNAHKGEYLGATFNFAGPDANNPRLTQVLEAVWNKSASEPYKIAAPMGASYIVNREFFLKLDPLSNLISWSCDEQSLALSYNLCGDGCYLARHVRIGHKFRREGKDKIPFNIRESEVLYNKLFLIHTMLPPECREILIKKLPRGGELGRAKRLIEDNWRLVEVARARFQSNQKHSFASYLQEFGLAFPTK